MEYSLLRQKGHLGEVFDKCPKCNFIGRTFLVLSEDQWVCLECGCYFMSKKRRVELRNELQSKPVDIKSQDKKQETEKIWKCKCEVCGKGFDKELYLSNHMKTHVPKRKKMDDVVNA